MDFQPLEITIATTLPVLNPLRKTPYPLHFDSLIIALMAAREKRINPSIFTGQPFDDPYAPENAENTRVPLGVAGKSRPVFMASAAFPRVFEHTEYTWIRTAPELDTYCLPTPEGRNPDNKYLQGGAQSGDRKQWKETNHGIHPGQIVFWCMGNGQAINDILQDLRGLGTKRNSGLGEVSHYSIYEIDTDNIETFGLINEGQPIRALPISDWKGQKDWKMTSMASRAPYWSSPRELCWTPQLNTTYPGRY